MSSGARENEHESGKLRLCSRRALSISTADPVDDVSQLRLITAALMLVLAAHGLAPAFAADQTAETGPVLFVCKHGSVKSLLAKLLFERAAAREGLAVASVSRATAPDPEVPEWMRAALERDGFDLGSWKPTAMSEADAQSARMTVTFDVSLPAGSDVPIEHWDGLPAVSKDYAAGRDAIAARIDQLVAELCRSPDVSCAKEAEPIH